MKQQRLKAHEYPHAWAHQTRNCGTSGNISFRGRCYYSYDTCIGEVLDVKGTRVFLINDGYYSSSTSSHQSRMHAGIPQDAVRIRVPKASWGGGFPLSRYADTRKQWAKKIFEYQLEKAAELFVSAEKRRKQNTRAYDIVQAHSWLEGAREVKRIFNIRRMVPGSSEESLATMQAAARATARADAAALKKRQAREKERLTRWLAGEKVSGYFPSTRVLFRVVHIETISPFSFSTDRASEKVIETTKGASVPYEEGEKAFKIAIKLRGKGWRSNGEQIKLGQYSVSSVNETGVIAGCHNMKWDDLIAFAKKEEWIK